MLLCVPLPILRLTENLGAPYNTYESKLFPLSMLPVAQIAAPLTNEPNFPSQLPFLPGESLAYSIEILTLFLQSHAKISKFFDKNCTSTYLQKIGLFESVSQPRNEVTFLRPK